MATLFEQQGVQYEMQGDYRLPCVALSNENDYKKLMHAQVKTSREKYLELWIQIIKCKISNQSRALSIMGLKVNIMCAIDIMVESLKRIVLDGSSEMLKLPTIIPIESLEGVTE